jgi:F-type H+-transporting ATPase subunit b
LELSWSTFLLEIINFLILIWILKRFLYKPVLNVIEKRRTGIDNRLAEAKSMHDEAETLKAEYEGRLADWTRERQQARDTLAQELDEERNHQMKALQTLLAQEREKAQVADKRRRAEIIHETERKALQQGTEFASRLLTLAASPELESRLLDLFLDQLSALSSEQIKTIKTRWGEQPDVVVVTSAYPIPEDQQQKLEEALLKSTGLTVPVNYEQDPDLLAGLRVVIGTWVLQANIKDELKGFAEFAHDTK